MEGVVVPLALPEGVEGTGTTGSQSPTKSIRGSESLVLVQGGKLLGAGVLVVMPQLFGDHFLRPVV